GQAELGGGGDFARQLAEQLGFDLILPPLAVHDVLELRMSGHGPLRGTPRAPSEHTSGAARAKSVKCAGVIFRRPREGKRHQNAGRACSSRPPRRTGPTWRASPVASSVSTAIAQSVAGP